MKRNHWESQMDKFHELRSSLRDPASGAIPRVMSVVSAKKGEGKTTVAACLAMSLAKQGQRVVVVELNFRNPGLSDFFAQPRSAGITDVLLGEAALEDIVKDVSGIHVACAGMATGIDPLELLESPGMGKLVEALKKDYAVVILDNSSISEYRDGVVTAQYADFIIYVVARGMASKERVKESLGLLGNNRIGIVFNKVRG